jgi:hypothetical protein
MNNLKRSLLNICAAHHQYNHLSPTTINILPHAAIDNIQTKSIMIPKEKRNKKFKNTHIIHCRHENQFQTIRHDMHHIYDIIFNGTPVMGVKMIVGHLNN